MLSTRFLQDSVAGIIDLRNENSNAIPEHIDESINKIVSKIGGDATPGSIDSQN